MKYAGGVRSALEYRYEEIISSLRQRQRNKVLVSPRSKRNVWNFSLTKIVSVYKFLAGRLNKAIALLLCSGRASIRAHPENGAVHTLCCLPGSDFSGPRVSISLLSGYFPVPARLKLQKRAIC